MKYALITGGASGMGRATAVELANNGFTVFSCDINLNAEEKENIIQIKTDVTDITSVQNAYNQVVKITNKLDVVINFAGVLPARNYDPWLFINSFTLGTLNVLEYMRNVNCRKIITAQTPADLWYLQNTATPMPADAPRSFPPSTDHSIYTIAKNAAIDIIEYYHNTYNFSRFILRFFNVYMYHPNPYYYVDGVKRMMSFWLIIEKAKKGEPIEVWGDPSRTKEMLYVKDLSRLVGQCIESQLDGGIYNVGSLKQVSLEEQIDGIIEVFTQDIKSEKVYCPEKPNALFNHLDISKTIAELNYSPQYSYIDWLRDFKQEEEQNRFAKLWGNKEDYDD